VFRRPVALDDTHALVYHPAFRQYLARVKHGDFGMKWSLTFTVAVFLAFSSLSGCGTIWNMEFSKERDTGERRIYGGLQIDANAAFVQPFESISESKTESNGPDHTIALCVLAIFDAPMSAIADTLTLPITIPATMKKLKANNGKPSDENTVTPERIHSGIE
jgi:uncharacterized protein YceK